MRTIYVVIVCLFAASSIAPAQTSPPNIGIQSAQCTLKPEQAPALRGFRFGMTLGDVKAKVPGFNVQQFGNGSASGSFTPLNVGEAEKIKYGGVNYINLNFLDERVVGVTIDYHDVRWLNGEQFTSAVSDKLALPRAWEGERLACNGWEVKASASQTSIGFSVLGTDEVLRKRQREKEELQRRAFQP